MPRRILAALLLAAIPAASQLVQLRHWSGQGIAPVYEGYDVNLDGTFNLWFGYMNRNYEEQIDLPVGAENHFEPGPADRGQPTHFLVRRQKDVFKVIVPKDFGDQKIVWTISAHGQSQQVAATLKPVWMIDHQRTTRGGNIETINSNTPPVVEVSPGEQTVERGQPVTLSLKATDDGLPVGRDKKPVGMTAAWGLYRGPASVTFDPIQSKLADGATSTKATFTEPGHYTLQVVVDDGSGELAGNFGYHCCWTNSRIRIEVK